MRNSGDWYAVVLVGLLACNTSQSSRPVGDARTNDASSGSSNGGLDINQSGSRIKMKVYNTPDGAKMVIGLYDGLRNEDCHMALAADGQTRCLPYTGVPVAANQYGDANCTVRVATWIKNCAALTYITTQVATGQTCGITLNGTGFHSIGTMYTSYYQKDSTGTCTGPTSNPANVYYAEGPEIPSSDFQSATIAVE